MRIKRQNPQAPRFTKAAEFLDYLKRDENPLFSGRAAFLYFASALQPEHEFLLKADDLHPSWRSFLTARFRWKDPRNIAALLPLCDQVIYLQEKIYVRTSLTIWLPFGAMEEALQQIRAENPASLSEPILPLPGKH